MSDNPNTEYADAWKAAQDEELDPVRAADLTGAADDQADTGGQSEPDPDRAAAADEPTADPQAGAAEAEETTDEFAGLSESELRERLKATLAEVSEERSKRTNAENTIRAHNGRLSRAERELNELRARMLAEAPAEEPKRPEVPTVDDETLNKIAEEYDDLGKPIVTAFRGLQARLEQAEQVLSQTRTQAAEAQREAAQRELDAFTAQQQQVLNQAHPDWSEIVKDPKYGEWAVAQPGWLQAMIARNGLQLVDGEAAVEVFNRFKRDTAAPADPDAERRKAQLEGSRHVPARAPAMEPTGKGGGSYEAEWLLAEEEDKRAAARR